MKLCKTCGQIKVLEDFTIRKIRKDGRDSRCRQCANDYYQINKEKLIARRKQHFEENEDRLLRERKEYFQSHREEFKIYSARYRAKTKDSHKQHRKEYRIKYEHAQREINPQFKLRQNLRRRMRSALNGNMKYGRTEELLGCTVEEFKKHLEGLFLEGMSWSNYGLHGWHIDHIKPCYSFDLTIPEEQQKCFHYTNQRPLWAKDNLSRTREDFIVRNKT